MPLEDDELSSWAHNSSDEDGDGDTVRDRRALEGELRVVESAAQSQARVLARCTTSSKRNQAEAEMARQELSELACALGVHRHGSTSHSAHAQRLQLATAEEQSAAELNLATLQDEVATTRASCTGLQSKKRATAGKRLDWPRPIELGIEGPAICAAELLAGFRSPEEILQSTCPNLSRATLLDILRNLLVAFGPGAAPPWSPNEDTVEGRLWADAVSSLENECERRQKAITELKDLHYRLTAVRRLESVPVAGPDARSLIELNSLHRELAAQRSELATCQLQEEHAQTPPAPLQLPHATGRPSKLQLEKLEERAAGLVRELRHLHAERRRQEPGPSSLIAESRVLRSALAEQEAMRVVAEVTFSELGPTMHDLRSAKASFKPPLRSSAPHYNSNSPESKRCTPLDTFSPLRASPMRGRLDALLRASPMRGQLEVIGAGVHQPKTCTATKQIVSQPIAQRRQQAGCRSFSAGSLNASKR